MKLLFRDKGHSKGTNYETFERISVWNTPAWKIKIRTSFGERGQSGSIGVDSMRHGDNQWHSLYHIYLYDENRLYEKGERPPEEVFDKFEKQGMDRAIMLIDGNE